MTVHAHLVETLTGPLPTTQATTPPTLEGLPGHRLLLQRGDDELVVVRAGGDTVRFPAPWPARVGTVAVAPDGNLAVFAGVDAVRAIDAAGKVRWEVRHGTWHHADGGSVGFSSDGRLVWAHVRGPLAEGLLMPVAALDQWLLLDAADGRLLAQVDARAAAAGSVHVPHPDAGQMGLSIGEGQDGSPLRWGRWDGEELSVDYFQDGHGDQNQNLVLIAVSPTGDHFLTVDHDQDTLAVHATEDGSVVAAWNAESVIPRHPELDPDNDEEEPYWDWAGGFIDEATVIAGSVESDEQGECEGRHWALTTSAPDGRPEQVTYPSSTSPGLPTALGDGTWFTVAGNEVQVWARA